MPVEITMPATIRVPNFAPLMSKMSAEVKSGELDLVSHSGVRQEVLVKVYRTSLEHFAVIHQHQQAKQVRPLCVLSLKNTSCQRLRDGFVVRQRDCDGKTAVTFMTDYRSEIDSWIEAFTVKTQRSKMPILTEVDECSVAEETKVQIVQNCRFACRSQPHRQNSLPILLEDDEC